MITREDLQNFIADLPKKAHKVESVRAYLMEQGESEENIKKILTDLNSYETIA